MNDYGEIARRAPRARPGQMSRRQMVCLSAGIASTLLLPGCGGTPVEPIPAGGARLQARPGTPAGTIGTGLFDLQLDRRALLYVPSAYRPEQPAPLALLLHGAIGDAHQLMDPLRPLAGAAGLLLLSVDSLGGTWDLIVEGSYGADVAFIDLALGRAFHFCAVAPQQVAVVGFSDGASYALALGTANGDLFSRIVAFSAGVLPEPTPVGKPRIFESHGIQDAILPIDTSGRAISGQLRQRGYDVTYVEFEGGHSVPAPIVQQAVAWLQVP